ncbi:anhydro-N-acetylmuramic acid kinase [Winogradskyella sp.]|uniref:anhydro-N-acetylmuramic acid kinase n=1 Tax=Winogradskyella sp. TaxID=1883156 RepID=UPI00370495E2
MDSYKVIGVMSGTSVDGVDLCAATFEFDGSWHYSIDIAETSLYPDKWEERLKNTLHLEHDDLQAFDQEYTRHLAEHINRFIKKHDLKNIEAVCSHGHTVFHQPERGLTYQIGNKPDLAGLVGHKVVCDFRVQDVNLGGQGAPLVPIGDRHLFGSYDICLNLGGFSNVSYEWEGSRWAYDVCPINALLNRYASSLGLPYDNGGLIAKSGNLNAELFQALNNLSYYLKKPPKSLGMEWVELEVLPLVSNFDIPVKDILNTLTEHMAHQIGLHLNPLKKSSMLISGGGTYNTYLIDRIRVFNTAEVIIPDSVIIDFKEALIFGFLGILRLRNETNCLKSVTGAHHDHCSGEVYLP